MDLTEASEPELRHYSSAGHEICWDCLCCKVCNREADELYDQGPDQLIAPCIDRTNLLHFCLWRVRFGPKSKFWKELFSS